MNIFIPVAKKIKCGAVTADGERKNMFWWQRGYYTYSSAALLILEVADGVFYKDWGQGKE